MQIIENKDTELICRLDKAWKKFNIKLERAGGRTNRNWIVKYNGKKFFVRLPWSEADVLNRRVEAKNILALSNCKKLIDILPLYYIYILKKKNILQPENEQKFDLPDGTLLSEFIEGKDLDGEDTKKAEVQMALVKTLHTFHDSNVKFVNNYDVFNDEMACYKNKLEQYSLNKLIPDKEIQKINDIEKLMRERIVLGGELSTHNDLIFENLRLSKNNRLYLLDFEYGGLNMRDGLYYDLGIILGGNLFQEKPMSIESYNQILKIASKIYGKKIDPYKAYCGALTNILIMFWWGAVKYFTATSERDRQSFSEYTLKRLKGIHLLYSKLPKSLSLCTTAKSGLKAKATALAPHSTSNSQ